MSTLTLREAAQAVIRAFDTPPGKGVPDLTLAESDALDGLRSSLASSPTEAPEASPATARRDEAVRLAQVVNAWHEAEAGGDHREDTLHGMRLEMVGIARAILAAGLARALASSSENAETWDVVEKCPNCENGSGHTRHLGRDNEEVVGDCPFHLVSEVITTSIGSRASDELRLIAETVADDANRIDRSGLVLALRDLADDLDAPAAAPAPASPAAPLENVPHDWKENTGLNLVCKRCGLDLAHLADKKHPLVCDAASPQDNAEKETP